MDLSIFVTPVALIAIFYFLVIRPQQKRSKQQEDLLGSLAPGDRVITYSGMYATVVEAGDPLKVSIADGIVVEIAPPAVASKLPAKEPEAQAETSAETAAEADDESGAIVGGADEPDA